MKTCTTTCDKCGKKNGMLNPIKNYNIGASDVYTLEKDLCGSCKHELEEVIRGFFK